MLMNAPIEERYELVARALAQIQTRPRITHEGKPDRFQTYRTLPIIYTQIHRPARQSERILDGR